MTGSKNAVVQILNRRRGIVGCESVHHQFTTTVSGTSTKDSLRAQRQHIPGFMSC